MNKKKGLLTTALAILLSSLLCLGLYQFDNKHSSPTIQPINGVLFYSDDADIYYLARQWEYYPDVLLTPETANNYSGYRKYQDIGGKMEIEKGSMTYRLTLLLPETEAEYALELSDIFSAYKLYINDRLLLQLGDPDPTNYKEEISSRIIPFTASGETTLLLAVSDYSGINRGMTYPPIFGIADTILGIREKRLFLHGTFALLAILGALLAITFEIGVNKKKGLLTGLLCLSLAIVTGYPLYHGFLITGVQPWYTIEPTSYYALLLLALLLQAMTYEITVKNRIILILPCFIGVICTLIRFGASGVLPDYASTLFSALSLILKFYTAFALVGTSIWALWKDKCHSFLLHFSSVGFATCLIWDRLLPLYEPIYGGWFTEIGGTILVFSLSAALWLDSINAYRFRLTYEAAYVQMEQRLALQKEHYKQLSKQIRIAREASHDLRHHIRTMKSLLNQEKWEELDTYFKEYETHTKERQLTIWSDHPIADAVLGYFASAAKEIDAIYDVRLAIPPNLPFPNNELCIILSNLLENSIDAMKEQKEGTRRIYLRGEVNNGHLGIVIDNTFNGELNIVNNVYFSTKHPGPGLGLSSVTSIVENYGGLVDYKAENGFFRVSLFIPLGEKN